MNISCFYVIYFTGAEKICNRKYVLYTQYMKRRMDHFCFMGWRMTVLSFSGVVRLGSLR